MDLNSPLFDRIRVKTAPREAPRPNEIMCDVPGCAAKGEFRAPMGRLREGQYFCFCMEHVRAYNASYNYFNGMTDEAVQHWMKEEVSGHRPTWAMGVNRAGRTFREEGVEAPGFRDYGSYRARNPGERPEPPRPRYGLAATKALETLGLDETANRATIKARYKELVKRLHPDANGGDRSSEDKLREIIHAYNHLKSAKLA